MTIVVDAALVVAALVDTGSTGRWAEEQLILDHLAAPQVMPAEVANILRQADLAGEISADTASMAHEDLLALRVELFPYDPFAARVWELRLNVTAYDAWYVALAESLQAQLATLDKRLSRTPGCHCTFRTPP